MKYGFDFGTTNSSIALKTGSKASVLKIDSAATDPKVIRTLLYFLRRELVISDRVPEKRLNQLVFKMEEISYTGVQEVLIGQQAVDKYIAENKFRHAGIIRRILTGRWVKPAVSESSDQGRVDAIPEYYEEVDFGTGRFVQGIKSALKSKFYTGTTVFGKQYSLEDLIATYVSEVKKQAGQTLDQQIDEVVCGRPVYFSDDPDKDKAAQDRLEQGLKQAGFKKISFQFEPIAAAKQYLSESGKQKGKVLVFDFGGGTLDTALVDAGYPHPNPLPRGEGDQGIGIKVLAADGVYIGGDLLNADICKAKLWDYFGASAIWEGLQMGVGGKPECK